MGLTWLYITTLAVPMVTFIHGSLLSRKPRDVDGKRIDEILTLLGPREQTDFVLLVDRSRGMQMDNFYLKEKRILERVIYQYSTLADTFVRIACLTFASDVESAFDSISWGTQRINKAELFSGNEPKWENVQYYYDADRFVETNLELALQRTADIFRDGRERRAGARQVLLMSTDGDYLRFDETVQKATQMKNAGVTIFAIGVGPWIASNAGNVVALVSQSGYYAEYSVWRQLLQLRLSNYDYDTTPDLELMDVMLTTEGFCSGGCTQNTQCMADIDTGEEACMCSAGFTRSFNDQGESICRACPLHTYKSSAGNLACRDCGSPMYTSTAGNTDPSSCICPADIISAGTQHLYCTDQCIDPVEACPGANQECLYTGTRTWQCSCQSGWLNTIPDNSDNSECITSLNDCNNNICHNGGDCVDLDNAFLCVCPPEYTGPTCLEQLDPCDENICLNGGTCTSESSIEFRCECPYGWGGRYCALINTAVGTTPPITSTLVSTSSNTAAASASTSHQSDDVSSTMIIDTNPKHDGGSGETSTFSSPAVLVGMIVPSVLFIITALVLALVLLRRRNTKCFQGSNSSPDRKESRYEVPLEATSTGIQYQSDGNSGYVGIQHNEASSQSTHVSTDENVNESEYSEIQQYRAATEGTHDYYNSPEATYEEIPDSNVPDYTVITDK